MSAQTRKSINISLAVFSVLAVIGVVCWILQLTKGLQMTNLGTTNMWGLYITGFMIFTGVAAGSLFFASVPYLFRLDEFKPYCRISAYVGAVSSIVAASLFIIVDIGNPERVWLFITSGNFTSPMLWDFIILLSYMVISVIFTRQLILVHEGKKDEKSVKPIAVLAFAAGILVFVTSFVFSFQTARPMWNTPAQPLSFLLAAFAVALAVLIILAFILNKIGYIHMPVPLISKMAKLCALLLAAELLIIIGEVLVGLYPGAGGEYEAVSWLVAGGGAIRFWLEMAAVVGALILLTRQASEKGGTILFCAIFAFAAVYLIKSNFLQAELFHPLL
ncbi:MAG: polysulfide reductase NrfD, partial [Bacillales bacterium]